MSSSQLRTYFNFTWMMLLSNSFFPNAPHLSTTIDIYINVCISTTSCTRYDIMDEYHINGHLPEICIFSFKCHIMIIRTTFNNLETHKIIFKLFNTFLEELYCSFNSLYCDVFQCYRYMLSFPFLHFPACILITKSYLRVTQSTQRDSSHTTSLSILKWPSRLLLKRYIHTYKTSNTSTYR